MLPARNHLWAVMDQSVLKDEFANYLAVHPDTRFVDAIYSDTAGFLRGKRYPADKAAKLWQSGLNMPEAHFILDITGDCSDPLGRGFSDGDPDCTIMPVTGSLCPVPWAESPRAQVMMTQLPSARPPHVVDPRQVFARIVERFRKTGLKPVMAFELEFYLLDPKSDPAGRPQAPLLPGTDRRLVTMQANSIDEMDRFGAFIAEVEAVCRLQGIPATATSTEFATGQYEINLDHVADPLTAADHALLLRRVVKAIAEKQGMAASFMAKPFLDRAGSGMHVHLSLVDEKGENRFDDGSPLGGPLLRHAVGGMRAAMAESMAIYAPHVNAFRRYAANMFVPVNRSWGPDNRSVAFRIPTGPGAARRIEHRVAAADANPYLVGAAILAAVQHGIENKVDPGPTAVDNVSGAVDPEIPMDLAAAIERLEGGKILAGAFDPLYLQIYATVKRNEQRSFMSDIFAREYAWYL